MAVPAQKKDREEVLKQISYSNLEVLMNDAKDNHLTKNDGSEIEIIRAYQLHTFSQEYDKESKEDVAKGISGEISKALQLTPKANAVYLGQLEKGHGFVYITEET